MFNQPALLFLMFGMTSLAPLGCRESSRESSGNHAGSSGTGASSGTGTGGADSSTGAAGSAGTGAGASGPGGTGTGGTGAGGTGAGGGAGGTGPGGSGATGSGGAGVDGGVVSCDECGSSEFCDYDYDYCGYRHPLSEGPGRRCAPRPEDCDAEYRPVCGCSGQVYSNPCQANAAGDDLGAGKCAASETPQGYFPVGPYYCDPTTSYGEVVYGDIGDRWFSCSPLPAACSTLPEPACSCLPREGFASWECRSIPGAGVEGLLVERSLGI